jgi:hypothetical protein
MPTEDHFTHRSVDMHNYFEAAQGVVVRVTSLKKTREWGAIFSEQWQEERKSLERREGQVDPEVLIFINNSPRPHHQEEMLKEHLQACHIPPHAL